MFICKGCHNKTECTALHISESLGRCEVCGERKTCYDCHHHKLDAEMSRQEQQLRAYRRRRAKSAT